MVFEAVEDEIEGAVGEQLARWKAVGEVER